MAVVLVVLNSAIACVCVWAIFLTIWMHEIFYTVLLLVLLLGVIVLLCTVISIAWGFPFAREPYAYRLFETDTTQPSLNLLSYSLAYRARALRVLDPPPNQEQLDTVPELGRKQVDRQRAAAYGATPTAYPDFRTSERKQTYLRIPNSQRRRLSLLKNKLTSVVLLTPCACPRQTRRPQRGRQRRRRET